MSFEQSSQEYFMFYRVKIKNKIVRLPKESIDKLLQEGKLDATSFISWDGKSWVPAVLPPGVDSNAKPTATFPQAIEEDPEWFYSKDGRCSKGPCTRQEMIDVILQGLLDEKTLVWKRDERESVLLSQRPEFRDYYEGVRGLTITKSEPLPVLEEKKIVRQSFWAKIFRLIFKND